MMRLTFDYKKRYDFKKFLGLALFFSFLVGGFGHGYVVADVLLLAAGTTTACNVKLDPAATAAITTSGSGNAFMYTGSEAGSISLNSFFSRSSIMLHGVEASTALVALQHNNGGCYAYYLENQPPSLNYLVYAVSFSTGKLISYETSNPAGTITILLSAGTLVSPASMVMGPDGNLYIGENGDGGTIAPRISKFEPATLTLSTVFTFGDFEVFPGSLLFQGNDLLIGRNPSFGSTGPIVKLSNATGGLLSVSDYTSGGSLASSPGLALAMDGKLYVSDQTYNLVTGISSGPVKRFDAIGNYVDEVIADGASGLAGPTGLVIDGSTLYTTSVMTGTALRTDLTNGSTTTFFSSGSPFEAGPLTLLSDGGMLLGGVSGNGFIYSVDSNGTLVSTFASGLGTVGGLLAVEIVPSAAPTNLAATPCGSQVAISFTAGSNGGSPITNYEYTVDGTNWTTFSPAVTGTTVTVTALISGT